MKIVFEKIRIFGAYFTGWTWVARITYALGSIDTTPMSITHLFTLGTDVDIINGPCHWLRASRVKSLVPSETHRSGKEVQVFQNLINRTTYLWSKHIWSMSSQQLLPLHHTQDRENVIQRVRDTNSIPQWDFVNKVLASSKLFPILSLCQNSNFFNIDFSGWSFLHPTIYTLHTYLLF